MKQKVIHKSTKMWITLWVWGITDTKVRIGHVFVLMSVITEKPYFIILFYNILTFN